MRRVQQVERHPYLGLFNFMGGLTGFVILICGMNQLGNYGHFVYVVISMIGGFFVFAYWHTLSISSKFSRWSQVSDLGKMIPWTNILVGSVVSIVLVFVIPGAAAFIKQTS